MTFGHKCKVGDQKTSEKWENNGHQQNWQNWSNHECQNTSLMLVFCFFFSFSCHWLVFGRDHWLASVGGLFDFLGNKGKQVQYHTKDTNIKKKKKLEQVTQSGKLRIFMLNLYGALCQLHLNQTGNEKNAGLGISQTQM